MKTLFPLTLIIGASFFMSSFARLENNDHADEKKSTETYNHITNDDSKKIVDTEILNDFFKRYTDLKNIKKKLLHYIKTDLTELFGIMETKLMNLDIYYTKN